MSESDALEMKLEPCPFCGKSNVSTFGPYGWYHQWGISHSCASFYNGTSEMMKGFPSEAEVIKAWNTRLSSPPPAVGGEVVDVRLALQHAKATFIRYAHLHRQKDTPEGDEKACANANMAEEMSRALEALAALTPQGGQ